MEIYKITNLINNKIYIGKDVSCDNSYYGSGVFIKQSINKHGKENFTKEIIDVCDNHDDLCIKEKFWISYYKENGFVLYNITEGGDGGDTWSNNPNFNSLKEKYYKPIIIDDVEYESISLASRTLCLERSLIRSRLKSYNFKNYLYKDNDINIKNEKFIDKFESKRKKISINGVEYKSVTDACKELKKPHDYILWRLQSKSYTNWIYISESITNKEVEKGPVKFDPSVFVVSLNVLAYFRYNFTYILIFIYSYMKHLIKFSLFEEVNPRDISFIESDLDNYFTVAFEFEIETEDTTNIKIKYDELDEDTVEDVISTVMSDFRVRKKSEKDLIAGLAYDLYDLVENDIATDDSFAKIFDTEKYKSEREKELVSHLRDSIKSVIYEENYTYLKRMVKLHLPNFTRKWNRKIDFVGDATLERGIEIKPKTYIPSLSESIDMINDFYSDLESQKYWKFSERTGIHINIGTNQKAKWNPIKGLLLLNDFSKGDETPYTFKGMTWRMNNKFCGSLIPYLKELKEKEKSIIKSIDINDLEKSEDLLNNFLTKKVNDIGFKNLGFNITKLEQNYVEFRYAGGLISKEILIEKVKYFCFIVYAMTNDSYKRKEYIKKLYKFIDTI